MMTWDLFSQIFPSGQKHKKKYDMKKITGTPWHEAIQYGVTCNGGLNGIMKHHRRKHRRLITSNEGKETRKSALIELCQSQSYEWMPESVFVRLYVESSLLFNKINNAQWLLDYETERPWLIHVKSILWERSLDANRFLKNYSKQQELKLHRALNRHLPEELQIQYADEHTDLTYARRIYKVIIWIQLVDEWLETDFLSVDCFLHTKMNLIFAYLIYLLRWTPTEVVAFQCGVNILLNLLQAPNNVKTFPKSTGCLDILNSYFFRWQQDNKIL
jgi:hypothetical protein